MACKIRVLPVRVRYYDELRQVDATRVVGYRAVCSCRWRSSTRQSVAQARAEAMGHRIVS